MVLSRRKGQRYRNDSEPTAGKSQRVQQAATVVVSVSQRTAWGASIEVCEGTGGHFLSYRGVGTYRGAAVACGTESRCRSWSFLPLGAEARLS
jgi:hypothetical protein